MGETQTTPLDRPTSAAGFRNLHLSLELEDLVAENERLKQELLKLEALWKQEHQALREAERQLTSWSEFRRS